MEREEYMRQALALAEEAAGHGDVPVGCVVVKDGAVIGRGCNRREERGDAAIRQACRAVGGWNLHDCALYVTLEPCPMCAGAIINARVGTVCYGARDEKAGACGSVLDLFAERFNHRPRVYGGVLKEACAALLQDFFHNLRKNSPDFSQN